MTNIGLAFIPSANQYQFRNAAGNAVLRINPVTGRTSLGSASNYSSFAADGDLEFIGGADMLIGNNSYAFRSSSDQDNGLFFNVTDNRYEFRSNAAVGSFWVNANTSGGETSGSFHSDGDGDIEGDLVVVGNGSAFSSTANNNATTDGGPLAVGPRTGNHMTFDNNEVQTYSGSTATGTFYAQFYGGNIDFLNDFGGSGYMNVSSGALFVDGTTDNVGMGTTAPGFTLAVSYPTGVTGHGIGIRNESAPSAWQLYAFSSGNLNLYYGGINKGGFDDVSGNYVPVSDVRYKDDIEKLDGGMLDLLLQLDPAQYHFQSDQVRERKYYGLIAQEVMEVMPSIVHYWDEEDRYGVSYTELIPVIIEAIQELDVKAEEGVSAERLNKLEAENERLLDMIEDLKTAVSACCSVDLDQDREAPSQSGAYLGQNIPNPFEGVSVIPYYLPEGVTQAIITVTDLTGRTAGQYTVEGMGFGQLSIGSTSLAPGTYLYNLVVDGKIIDTKRMVMVR